MRDMRIILVIRSSDEHVSSAEIMRIFKLFAKKVCSVSKIYCRQSVLKGTLTQYFFSLKKK